MNHEKIKTDMLVSLEKKLTNELDALPKSYENGPLKSLECLDWLNLQEAVTAVKTLLPYLDADVLAQLLSADNLVRRLRSLYETMSGLDYGWEYAAAVLLFDHMKAAYTGKLLRRCEEELNRHALDSLRAMAKVFETKNDEAGGSLADALADCCRSAVDYLPYFDAIKNTDLNLHILSVLLTMSKPLYQIREIVGITNELAPGLSHFFSDVVLYREDTLEGRCYIGITEEELPLVNQYRELMHKLQEVLETENTGDLRKVMATYDRSAE